MYCCHRVSTQLRLNIYISYLINRWILFMWNVPPPTWKLLFSFWKKATVGKIVKQTWQRLFLCSAGICRTWHSVAPALNLNTPRSPLPARCTSVKYANMDPCRIRWSLFKFLCKSQVPDSSLLCGTERSSTQPYSPCRQRVQNLLHSDSSCPTVKWSNAAQRSDTRSLIFRRPVSLCITIT
jgi:hypothetical protein